jgi:hypothetical protein
MVPLSNVEGDDLFPEDDSEQRDLVDWINKQIITSRGAKSQHEDRWKKYYKMYRSFVKKRSKGDWRSRVWMPLAFYVIESITPRLVAQLPKFTVLPVGPEDTQPAKEMESLLDWATDRSGLYLELVKGLKSALIYGTGIFKTLYDEKTAYEIKREPVMEPVMIEVATGDTNLDGSPITQPSPTGEQQPTGEFNVTRTPYTSYAGPVAEAVDIGDFFIDPVADSIESARYVIHRVWRDKAHLEDMFNNGTYHRPDKDTMSAFVSEHTMLRRMGEIDLGPGSSPNELDSTLFAVYEIWTDDFILAALGTEREVSILLRAERNPYAHAEKPFVRIVDHLVPHEFWGIGELEALEGIQDTVNAIWNSRIDNVKMSLNTMFLAVMDYLIDPADLQVRPAGVVRVREGIPLNQVVQPLEMGDVTASAYTEVQSLEELSQRVSGVSPYTTGGDSPSFNRTATGVALISEQGNTRFAHKVKMAELTGFTRLARHYASILQQYMPMEMAVRIIGPDGAVSFQQITADSITGRFDFDIESESSSQTESLRREQTLSLFQMLVAMPEVKRTQLIIDVLNTFGRKDIESYLYTPEELQMMQMQAQGEQAMAAQGEQAPPEEAPPEGG